MESTKQMSTGATKKIAGQNLAVTFTDTDDWGSGFVGQITIANTGTSDISGWTIAFDLPENITNIWNATIVSHVGTHYVITAASWDSAIKAGGSVSFGFQATGGNPPLPTSYVVNGTTLSDTPQPPTLSIGNAMVSETGATTVNETFTVTLSSASSTPVTVHYATVDGTAKAGVDYTAISGTLTFAAGVVSQTITVATHPGVAGTHAYTVVLSNPTGATIATPQGTGTIVDPPPPALTIGDATVTEGSSGTVNEVFTVKLSSASTAPVTVHYATADGTAKAGVDYTATSGTLTFAPGTTSQTITVPTQAGSAGTHTYSVTLSQPSGATISDGSAVGTIIDPSLPGISAQNASVQVGQVSGGGSGPGSLLPAGYLSTSGNQIVDSSGNAVKIAAVNWFGMETPSYAPGGLWAANYKTMMQQMVQSGFNAIRLPFSLQLFDAGSTPNGINYNLNPDLQGLNGLQIMDKIVDYAGQIGLKIILDDHRSAAGSGPNGDGLWYDGGYTEAQWISTWKMLAQHYANNSTVIGADLSNEPHGAATWGDGGPNDWAAAATRAGDAIQSVNPNLLILVEGIESYNNQYDWWGGNLMGVAQHPVVLNVPNKVVYSPHDYPASVYDQSWFNAANYPNNLPAVWTQYWGYIYQQNLAPVLLGEFGTKLATTSDQQWLAKLVAYMDGDFSGTGNATLPVGHQGISWAYWDWNPNSGDTGGILQDDWKTLNQAKLTAIDPAMYHPSGSGTGSQSVSFTVTLSAPSTQTVTVHYATEDGTAKAGVNYVATSGTLTFAPGVTSAVISAQVLDPPGATGQMQFLLDFSSPANASLISTNATATIDYGGTTSGGGTGSSGSGSGATTTGGAALHVDNDWGSGLTATVTVTNGGTVASSAWQVEVDTNDLISNVWNGTIVSHQGSTYVISNATWNGTVPAGGSTSFGFQASEAQAGAPISVHLIGFTS